MGHVLVLHQVQVPDKKELGPFLATKDMVRADGVVALDDKTLLIRSVKCAALCSMLTDICNTENCTITRQSIPIVDSTWVAVQAPTYLVTKFLTKTEGESYSIRPLTDSSLTAAASADYGTTSMKTLYSDYPET